MAEIATIARPYAEALYQSAKGDPSATWEWLEGLGQFAANPELLLYVENPQANTQQVLELLEGLLQKPLPEEAKNLVTLLLANGRFAVLPAIATHFKDLKNAGSGVSEAVVYSAFELTEQQKADLQRYLEKRFERTLHLEVREDAALIVGVRVVLGDEVLDLSARAQLEEMKIALAA